MSDNKYLQAIRDAQRLLTELLNDPEHGNLTFKGARGLGDLTITGPEELNDVISGALVVIGDVEWMALGHNVCEPRQWQRFTGGHRATSEELYRLALENADNLHYIHDGLRSGMDL